MPSPLVVGFFAYNPVAPPDYSAEHSLVVIKVNKDYSLLRNIPGTYALVALMIFFKFISFNNCLFISAD